MDNESDFFIVQKAAQTSKKKSPLSISGLLKKKQFYF